MSESQNKSTSIVLILFFILMFLIVVLIFLYKKLNKETSGEYTIRRMVYKEGGIRDRARGAVLALETRLGVQLYARREEDADGEEMQEIHSEEEQVGNGRSRSSSKAAEEEEEADNVEGCCETNGDGGNTPDDTSSLESLNTEEQTKLVNGPETEGEREEKGEQVGEEERKGETSGGTGLLIDLKQFSGSAIWSEEKGDEGKDGDVTVL